MPFTTKLKILTNKNLNELKLTLFPLAGANLQPLFNLTNLFFNLFLNLFFINFKPLKNIDLKCYIV